MTDRTPGGWTPTQYATNQRILLGYDRLASSAGEPLLLIMGTGISRRWWPQGLAEAFAGAGFEVGRFDNRDSGESSRTPETPIRNPLAALALRRGSPYTFEDLADDTVAVLDALGWQRAHLFGHSMGGLVAQRVGLRHPDRVLSLTSSGAQPSDAAGLAVLRHIHLGRVLRFAATKHAAGRTGDAAAARMAMDGLTADPGTAADEAVLDAWSQPEIGGELRDPAAQSRQLGATWHGPRLSELTVPALIMHGLDDPLVKVSAAIAQARAIPGAKLVGYAGVGHYLPARSWSDIASEVARHAAQV